MTNALRGMTELRAGEEVYSLLLDINALCELESELDQSFDVILGRYSAGSSVSLVRALVWAGLRHSHPCSIEEAGDIVTKAGVARAREAVEKALVSALPEEDSENPQKRGRTKKAAGAG